LSFDATLHLLQLFEVAAVFWIVAGRTVAHGPLIPIDCPACHATGIPSSPRHLEEPLRLFGLIPLFTLRSTFIQCGACGKSLTAPSRDLDNLYRLSPAELSASLRPYVPLFGRFLVVSSLVLFWFPFLSPALALGGLITTWRHRAWRRAAVIAVCLSLLVALAVACLFIFAPRSPPYDPNGHRQQTPSATRPAASVS
jgi:hypothetical protein